MPNVIAVLNPITREQVSTTVPAGVPLYESLNVPDHVLIQYNGEPYNGEVLADGDLINLTVPPRGGDGNKDGLRYAGAAVLFAASIYFSGGATLFGSKFLAGAVSIGSAIGANALIPVPDPDIAPGQEQEKFTRLGSLTGTRNQYRPYSTVPRVYGKRKLFPPMSARPYTEIEGSNQYQRHLFCVGSGPVQLAKPKIGSMVVGNFNVK